MSKKKILIVGGEISYAIFLKAIEKVHRDYPDSEVYVLTERRFIHSLKDHPLVSGVFLFDHNIINCLGLIKKIKYFLQHRVKLCFKNKEPEVIIKGEESFYPEYNVLSSLRYIRNVKYHKVIVLTYRNNTNKALSYTFYKYDVIGLLCRKEEMLHYDQDYHGFSYSNFLIRTSKFVFSQVFIITGFMSLLTMFSFLYLFRCVYMLAAQSSYKDIISELVEISLFIKEHIKLTFAHNPALLKYDMLLFFSVMIAMLTKNVREKENHKLTKRFLFIRIDQIGDMVHMLPALQKVKKTYPDATVSVILGEGGKEVIAGCPYIDEVILYRTDNPRFYRGNKKIGLMEKLRFYWTLRKTDYDVAIDPTGEQDSLFILIMSLANRKATMGHRLRRFIPGVNVYTDFANEVESERILKLLNFCVEDMPVSDINPKIYLTEENKQFARTWLADHGINLSEERPIVGIHPGGGWRQRLWPIDKFAEVSKRLLERYPDVTLLYFAAPSESGLLYQFQNLFNDRRITVVKDLGLGQFMGVTRFCDLFICNDSGPMHIATGLGVKVISIFGPGNFRQWVLPSQHKFVIKKDLPCSPCSQLYCEDNICLKEIGIEDVWKVVDREMQRMGSQKILAF